MTPKERCRIAMSGGRPDHVPVIPQICPPHAIRVAGLPFKETVVDRLRHPERYDLLVADCAVNYGVDGFRAWLAPAPQEVLWRDGKAYGLDPDTGKPRGVVDFEGGGAVVLLPEARRKLTRKDIDEVEVPAAGDLVNSEELRPLRKAVAKYGREHFIIGVPPLFMVEMLYFEQGMEPTLIDIVERPDFIRDLTAARLEASVQYALAMADAGADAFYVGETFGQFLSPTQFEELCLPYIQEFIRRVRPAGPLIYLHMCGRVTHLLDLIAQTGADCLEPLDEVGGTPVAEVKARLGDRMALMGGLNTVLLARGTEEQVRADCERCIREAGAEGGFLLAAGDMLPTETSSEKVRIMLDVARTSGRYHR